MVNSKDNKRAIILFLLGIILCIPYLLMCHRFGRTPEMKSFRCLFKIPINLCWMGVACIGSKRMQGDLKKKILMALTFYMIGDILAPAHYLVGGVAFGIGHLFIISGYIRQYGMSRRQLGCLAAISAVLITILIASLGFDWKIPFISIYIIILATLYVSSFGDKYYFLTVNIFLLSDVIAYVRKMFFNYNWLYDITLSVYYLAIFLYCFSFWKSEEK